MTDFKAIAGNALNMLMVALSKVEPIEKNLAGYLQGCTTQEIRDYFQKEHGIDPLIVQVNEKMHVFDMKPLIERSLIPETEHKHIKIIFEQ